MHGGHDIVVIKEANLSPPLTDWGDESLAGFSQFISQLIVKDYVIDDTLFIVCEVDTL